MDISVKKYRKCHHTCESCESKGNDEYHHCLSCNSNYSFPIYKNESGMVILNCYTPCTYLYYFEGTKLYKIEQKSGKGPQTVVEITEFTESADSSLFEEPKGYINLSDLVKSN